jgi:excisionase family DNA binding protein
MNAITLAEAARRTGLSRRTIGRMLEAGTLRGDRDGTTWRVDPTSLPKQARRVEVDTVPQVEVDRLTAEVDAERARADHAEAVAAERRQTAERLTVELDSWRRRAEVAEAVAAERQATLDVITPAVQSLRSALDAATNAIGGSRPVVTATELAPRRRWWKR